MDYRSDFDIDLKYGQIGEKTLQDILAGKIEVKTERGTWKTTGNIAIEFKSRGNYSGIAVTKADWWATILMDGDSIVSVLLTPTSHMKKLFLKYLKNGRRVKGGDNNTSDLVLIPLREIYLK